MLKFDLNVSILLNEYPFLERFDQAARLGFGAVEFWWPKGYDLGALAQIIRDAGLQVALFNFDGGNLVAGERGLLNNPERQQDFRANVPVALEFAQRVGCTRINALVGKWRAHEGRESQLARVGEQLMWAAEQARQAGVTVVVESLNSWDVEGYMLTNTRDTLHFLDSVPSDNLAYQYDVYHMQRMEGNIVATINAHHKRIGHIQIADSPGRNQPGTGELNYPFILAAIDASGYTGSIGLEYNSCGTTVQSLAWLPTDRRRAISVDELSL